VIRRIFRLHQNGRTLLGWWVADGDVVVFPGFWLPSDRFEIRFHAPGPSMVMRNGALLYRFEEEIEPPPPNTFHRVEFLFDNDLWIIEYRREQDG
jgi:hypothetical protein